MGRKGLLVLHVPPPYGGGEILAQQMYEYFRGKKEFLIFLHKREKSSKSSQGITSLGNILFGLKWIARITMMSMIQRPVFVFMTIPKEFSPFLRTGVLILIMKILGVKILGKLGGTSFRFLENKGTIKYRLGQFILQKVDEINIEGESIRPVLKAFNLTRCVAMLSGTTVPDTARINMNSVSDPVLRIITVGSVNFAKGAYNSVKAMALCKEKGLKVKLDFLGEWHDEKEETIIMRFIAQHNLEDYIHFEHTLTGTSKWEFFGDHAILLHPTYWDGLPVTILEALGLGMSIIATPIGAIPDVIEDGVNGLIMKENTPNEILRCIEFMYNNRSWIQERIGINSEKYRNFHTSEKYMKQLEQWFRKHLR